MEKKFNYRIFISYRREGGDIMARLLYEVLVAKGYSVFYDHESLSSGRFDQKLLDVIEGCEDVLVVLPKDALNRCKDEGDWLCREITYAVKYKKQLIPLFLKDFDQPTETEKNELPEALKLLLQYQGFNVEMEFFDSVVSKIERNLSSPPDRFTAFQLGQTYSDILKHIFDDENVIKTLPRDEQKEIILKMLLAIFEEQSGQIIYNMILPYLNKIYTIRPYFQYEILLEERFPFSDGLTDSGKYYKIGEKLEYNKKFLDGELSSEFWIAFITDLDELDESLRKAKYLFSENLIIDREDMDILVNMDEEKQNKFYHSVMRLQFSINRVKLIPEEIMYKTSGIFAKYILPDKIDVRDVIDVRLAFSMPYRKGNNVFLVVISEPTFSPRVVFSYPDDEVSVKMVPFLSNSITSKEASFFPGECDFWAKDEWIMPMSGAVFIIDNNCKVMGR